MDWFYAQDGRQMGPVTESRLNELADSGDVSPDTLVWHSGMPEWQPFRSAFATFAPERYPLAISSASAIPAATSFPRATWPCSANPQSAPPASQLTSSACARG